jgi:hypothetical protein
MQLLALHGICASIKSRQHTTHLSVGPTLNAQVGHISKCCDASISGLSNQGDISSKLKHGIL